jgi:hypothetical protein
MGKFRRKSLTTVGVGTAFPKEKKVQTLERENSKENPAVALSVSSVCTRKLSGVFPLDTWSLRECSLIPLFYESAYTLKELRRINEAQSS